MKKKATKKKGKSLKKLVITKNKVNMYHVKTLDGGSDFNFFTEATNHKKALQNLIIRSSDYNNLVKSDADLTIIVTKIKKP
jgi:hypothetical protein